MTQALASVAFSAFGKPAGAPELNEGRQAAQQLLAGFDEYFDDAVKPSQVTADSWVYAKTISELQIHSLDLAGHQR